MSTRNGGVSPAPLGMNLSLTVGDDERNVAENRKLFFSALGIDAGNVAIPRQVHGSTVVPVTTSGKYDACDALITNTPDTFLVISAADCLPIFLYDPVTRSIAAVHSGWRGSKARIVQTALAQTRERYGSDPRDVYAWFGPSAGGCCYEVGEEVAADFDTKYVIRNNGSKPHLELKDYNKDLLLQAGVREENIEVSPDCTIHMPAQYHSFRRDGNRSGRMWVVMGIRK